MYEALSGIGKAISRIKKEALLYMEILKYCQKFSPHTIDLKETPFFEKVLESFGPCLPLSTVSVNLKEIFNVAFHTRSGSLIIANKGVTIASLSPLTSIPYITRHLVCCVYHPQIGLETVNIGIIGDVYKGEVIVRAESACPPSFLFGSQRCKCNYQWACIRELAAHINRINFPSNLYGDRFEHWVKKQFSYHDGKHVPAQGGRGMILLHLDSQSGRGCGWTENEFSFDLYNRALIRHAAQNTVEQIYQTPVNEGFESLGLPEDCRKKSNQAGYQIPAIILDWLGASKSLVVLSNTNHKLKQLQEYGFEVKRVTSLGKVDTEVSPHLTEQDYPEEELTFDQELQRLKHQLVSSRQQSFC